MKTLQDLTGQQMVDILTIIVIMICLLTFLLGILIGTWHQQYKYKNRNKKRTRLVKGKLILKDGRVIGIEKDDDGLPRIVISNSDAKQLKKDIKSIKKQMDLPLSKKNILDQLNEAYGEPYKENQNDSTKGILDSDGRSA